MSYSLPLLVGFDLVEIDDGGRPSAMGRMRLLVNVEGIQRPMPNLACGPASEA